MQTSERKNYSFTLPTKLMSEIEQRRGDVSKGLFIQRILEKHLHLGPYDTPRSYTNPIISLRGSRKNG